MPRAVGRKVRGFEKYAGSSHIDDRVATSCGRPINNPWTSARKENVGRMKIAMANPATGRDQRERFFRSFALFAGEVVSIRKPAFQLRPL